MKYISLLYTLDFPIPSINLKCPWLNRTFKPELIRSEAKSKKKMFHSIVFSNFFDVIHLFKPETSIYFHHACL